MKNLIKGKEKAKDTISQLKEYFDKQIFVASSLAELCREKVFQEMGIDDLIRELFCLGRRIGLAFYLNQDYAETTGKNSPDYEQFFNLAVPTFCYLGKQIHNSFWRN